MAPDTFYFFPDPLSSYVEYPDEHDRTGMGQANRGNQPRLSQANALVPE